MFNVVLSAQWQNNFAELQVMSPSAQMIHQENSSANINQATNNAIAKYSSFFQALIESMNTVIYHVCCFCARISNCMEHQIHQSDSGPNIEEIQTMQTMSPTQQITFKTHRYSQQLFSPNCKSCQTKLYKNVDSLKQMRKPMDSIKDICESN